MNKKHDENKDLRLISRIAKIDYSTKTIQAPKTAIIGIKSWGRIDFLTHYCGWHFIWNNNATPVYIQNSDDSNNNDVVKKKQKKEHKLTDKTKKNTKKK